MKAFGFLLVTVFTVILMSCGGNDITGSWVEPIPGREDGVQGFELKRNGEAVSINMATLQYESWRREGDMLILQGTSIGNRQSIEFTDSLSIGRLTTDSLVLTDRYGGWMSFTRQR